MSGWNKQLNGLELNTEEQIHSLEFATSQEAWEKLNEGFLRLESSLFAKGATANSGVAVVYNVFIKIPFIHSSRRCLHSFNVGLTQEKSSPSVCR